MIKPLKNTGTERLSEVINFEKDIAPYNLIQLVAGVGAGKNYWTCELANEGYRVLLITSRTATAQAQAKKMNADRWFDFSRLFNKEEVWGEIPNEQKKVICTNAQIEIFTKKYYDPENPKTHIWNYFDFIFLDEAHSLSADATFADSPFYVERFLKYAHKQNKKCRIIVMTGTPEPINWLFEGSEKAVHKLDYFNRCIHVEPPKVFFIPSSMILELLAYNYKEGRRAIYFINMTNSINGLIEDLKKCGVPEEAIGVAYSKKEDDIKFSKNIVDSKYEIENSLKENEKLPDRIKILITTSVHKEGISIENEDIFAVFSESHVHSDLTQMIGRVRNGAEYFFVIYDAEQHFSKEKPIEEYVRGESAKSVASAATDFLYGSSLSKWPQIIKEIETNYFDVRYDSLSEMFFSYKGRIEGKKKVRKDKNDFREFIENWNEPCGEYGMNGWEELQSWFPYSQIEMILEDENKNNYENLQNDIDAFLEDNEVLNRIINHDKYDSILAAINSIIKNYPKNQRPARMKFPAKRLASVLKKFGYDVTARKHGENFIITKVICDQE